MLGLRPEFTKELLGLLSQELQDTKHEDAETIRKLQEEIQSLKQKITDKDAEIDRLKSQVESKESTSAAPQSMAPPRKNSSVEVSPTKKRVSLTSSRNQPKPSLEKHNEFDTRLTKSMYVNIHQLPTQYSSSSEGEAEEADKENEESGIRVSPRKTQILFSSQGSIRISPKRKLYFNTKTKDLSPLKKIPRLENNNMGSMRIPSMDKDFNRELEVSRSTEEEELEVASQHKKGNSQNKSQPLSQSKTNVHQLSTQYSQSSDSVLQQEILDYLKSSPTKQEPLSSPSKGNIQEHPPHEDNEVIEDSQEVLEDLIANSSQIIQPPIAQSSISTTSTTSMAPLIDIPPEYNTVILQRKYRLQFYIDKFHNDPDFKVNFRTHPTKTIKWDFVDFVPNKNHRLDEQMRFIKRNNIKSEAKYQKFIKVFADKPEVQQFGEFGDVVSQIFDKFQSPPGFMRSEFPDTQEQMKRKEIVQERQERRIFRRIEECLKVDGESRGLQIGEFVFAIDIFNKYVSSNRYYIE
ncbi:hypothetical protein Cantr_09638 [Candida viswanathii]|uniref:Uncharacterized protein n=1 Tax=Candida viswanathii TaxID=5486 RepID=A0A367YC70_9ASCO|nr:hypothetical protein Cantr_09638 [Candida viswanathii]